MLLGAQAHLRARGNTARFLGLGNLSYATGEQTARVCRAA